MKNPKTYYPFLVAAVIAGGALIPTTSGEEKKSSRTEVAANAEDPVVATINQKLVSPLNLQFRYGRAMTRSMPSSSTSYLLVENKEDAKEGIRQFQVMKKTTFYRKGTEPKQEEYLLVRHLAEGDQVLVKLKEEWIPMNQHPLLKLLPEVPAATVITP